MIVNTEEFDRHPEWCMGGNPQAIENQEKEGQQQLCSSNQLPIDSTLSNDSAEELKKHGIKVLSKLKDDDLFYDVILPDGWRIVPADRSTNSHLIDDNNIIIAKIYYKAAFYDRKARINFS